jgi:hypothetical protein
MVPEQINQTFRRADMCRTEPPGPPEKCGCRMKSPGSPTVSRAPMERPVKSTVPVAVARIPWACQPEIS